MKATAHQASHVASAAELLEQLNAEAGKLHTWIRTKANAPAQQPWFTDTTGIASTVERRASGRIGANQMKMATHHWRWKDIHPYLLRIAEIAQNAELKPLETTDRQGILLSNPGLGGRLQVTNTIRCAIAIYNPGDIAPAHVHSANASRTILSAKGGYTTVEGERCECNRGDIVLTSNGTWHDHCNDDVEPMIWVDILDLPLMEYLDCFWVDQAYRSADPANNKSQPVVHSDGYSSRLYGHGGLKPVFLASQRGFGHGTTPLFHYRGTDIEDSLHSLRGEKGDPYEGIKMEFINPDSGGPVFATLDYCAQLLRPGEELLLKRETCTTFMLVMNGKGFSEIGGQRFDWETNDILAIPNFLWRRHVNTGTDVAILYTVSDAALHRAIGQYRAQGMDKDGAVVQIVA